MTKTTENSKAISLENNGLCLKGKYEKLRKGVYKLTMEIPFKFERDYKEDILESDELIKWIMRQEMAEIIDDYYEIKENSSIFEKIISEIEELKKLRDLSKHELKSNLFNLLEKYFTKENQSLKPIIDGYSISEIKYLLTIDI